MGEAVRSKFGGTIAVGEAVSVFSVSFPMTFLLSEPVTTEWGGKSEKFTVG